MTHRAYTEVGPGTARLGNAWWERAWSAFVGNTIELTQRAGQFQWLAGGSPEFQIHCPDRFFGIMDLGDVEWSEECTPHAAGLVLRKQGPEGVGVVICTYAFHDHPGMLRTFRVYNAGRAAADITEVSVEVLSLRDCEISVHSDAPRAVFTAQDHGLAIEIEEDPDAVSLTPDGTHYAIVTPGPGLLLPGSYWDGPAVRLIPFTGDPGEHIERLCATFEDRVSSFRCWQARRAAAQSREDEAAADN